MNCPGCGGSMDAKVLEGHGGTRIELDVCLACRVFWFDKYESVRLSPAATLTLFQLIGEAPARAGPLPDRLQCPRCGSRLRQTHDIQRNTRFLYWRCDRGHGRIITFFEFLREKDFIRPLSPQQIAELREQVQTVSCSHCGGPVDLAQGSACPHCGSPLSMLDMRQAGRVIAELQAAARPRAVDPSLPLQLERARREAEAAFAEASGAGRSGTAAWWQEASSVGLVEAGLGVVARWLNRQR